MKIPSPSKYKDNVAKRQRVFVEKEQDLIRQDAKEIMKHIVAALNHGDNMPLVVYLRYPYLQKRIFKAVDEQLKESGWKIKKWHEDSTGGRLYGSPYKYRVTLVEY